MGINVIYVRCNVDVNRDCTFGNKLSQIPVPLMRRHLQCRDTFAWPNRCPYKTGSTVVCGAECYQLYERLLCTFYIALHILLYWVLYLVLFIVLMVCRMELV